MLPRGHSLANFGSLLRGKPHESDNGHSIVVTFDPKVTGHFIARSVCLLQLITQWCLDLKPFDPQLELTELLFPVNADLNGSADFFSEWEVASECECDLRHSGGE